MLKGPVALDSLSFEILSSISLEVEHLFVVHKRNLEWTY